MSEGCKMQDTVELILLLDVLQFDGRSSARFDLKHAFISHLDS